MSDIYRTPKGTKTCPEHNSDARFTANDVPDEPRRFLNMGHVSKRSRNGSILLWKRPFSHDCGRLRGITRNLLQVVQYTPYAPLCVLGRDVVIILGTRFRICFTLKR